MIVMNALVFCMGSWKNFSSQIMEKMFFTQKYFPRINYPFCRTAINFNRCESTHLVRLHQNHLLTPCYS